MNMIKKLTSKPKMVIIAGSLLLGLALTPATSFAGNDNHEGRRNGGSHQVDNHQSEHNRHHNKRGRHHMKHKYSHHGKHRHYHHGKHRNRHYNEPHYVVINNEPYYRPEPSRFRIGVHSGNFDVIFRD